ncbi:hypothetical protein BUALT_Bualt13G0056400 [Buddleja alternifolia]|uniref:F-box protein n=1 Tax=Buddleja alternifolia TaxID=168488 RepID=A0AAV6WSS3_9LAMI|nr:hypothetical protein BUALT_Bualt13G0056400 [Buddleja alternifolia]
MCPSSNSTTANHGGDTPITAVHPDIIQSHILNRLDGPTLVSTACASAQLLNLCSDDHLWKDICNSTWPSTAHAAVADAISAFRSGHRSFYSDSFPVPRRQSRKTYEKRINTETSKYISAVDIFYDDVLIYSKVFETETLSGWFLSSPFRLELLEQKETVATPLKFDGEDGACMSLAEERLRVSWILIDPAKKRAVNVGSVKAVESRRHWMTEEIELRYTAVMAAGGGELVQFGVVVTCRGEDGGALKIGEVCMLVEDIDGKIVTGWDSLGILQEAMEGQRWKSDGKVERDIYEMFLRRKVESRERKEMRERNLDVVCIATVCSIFFAIWVFFISR